MNVGKTGLRYVKILARRGVRKKLIIGAALIPLTLIIASCTGSVGAVEPDTTPEPSPLPVLNPEPVQTTNQEQAAELVPTPIIETMPTGLQVTDLEINPAEVNPGEPFLVTAKLTNTSDFEDTYAIQLMVNNITKFATEVSLPAGDTVELRVSGGEQVPGAYILDLNGVTEQFVVREAAETLILSSPDPGTDVLDQDTSGGCCGDGSSGQGGCGCSGSSSSQSSDTSSSRGGCGCGG